MMDLSLLTILGGTAGWRTFKSWLVALRRTEKSFPCSEVGCQERATHRFRCDGVIRNMCAAHYKAMFKFMEPPNAEITLHDIRPTEKINLSVEVP